MARLGDRVKETTTTAGTGAVALLGAVTQFQSFADAFSNLDSVYYAIVGQTGAAWEVGRGVFTLAGTTLSRDFVFDSSNAGALVNFAAGTKDVFCTAPAQILNLGQIMQGAASPPVVTPNDPTQPALYYPNGGGTLYQWSVSGQVWV